MFLIFVALVSVFIGFFFSMIVFANIHNAKLAEAYADTLELLEVNKELHEVNTRLVELNKEILDDGYIPKYW